MNPMTTFASPAGQSMRVVDRAGEPWFVAADVCQALEVRNPRQAISRLDDDEKDVISNDTLGGAQRTNVVSESGLYSLIMGSRKPETRPFRRWVTHDVLPTIRKSGRYEAPNQASGSAYHQIFQEGYRQGREETLATLERFRVIPIRVGRPPHTNAHQPAPAEKVGGQSKSGSSDDGAFLLPGMVEAVKGSILKFAGEQTTMTAIFEHVRIPRNRANEMGVAYLLKSNGYERFHQMSKGIRTWVYRMAEHA